MTIIYLFQKFKYCMRIDETNVLTYEFLKLYPGFVLHQKVLTKEFECL